MKCIKILVGFLLFLNCELYAQNGDFSIGARASSMADASVTLSDEWALFNNIGALADVNTLSVFGSYKNLYGFPELSSVALGGISPLWNGTVGVGIHRFGGRSLNEHRVNLGYSNRFGIVSLGLNVGYYQIAIENGGSTGNLLIDFGGRAELTEQLYFGAHISNLNQAQITTEFNRQVPTIMKAGISYRPYNKLMINTEAQKSLDEDLFFKIGLEYAIIEYLKLRAGIKTISFESDFGIGFRYRKIQLDYSYGFIPDLGNIHQFSFVYQIKSNEN